MKRFGRAYCAITFSALLYSAVFSNSVAAGTQAAATPTSTQTNACTIKNNAKAEAVCQILLAQNFPLVLPALDGTSISLATFATRAVDSADQVSKSPAHESALFSADRLRHPNSSSGVSPRIVEALFSGSSKSAAGVKDSLVNPHFSGFATVQKNPVKYSGIFNGLANAAMWVVEVLKACSSQWTSSSNCVLDAYQQNVPVAFSSSPPLPSQSPLPIPSPSATIADLPIPQQTALNNYLTSVHAIQDAAYNGKPSPSPSTFPTQLYNAIQTARGQNAVSIPTFPAVAPSPFVVPVSIAGKTIAQGSITVAASMITPSPGVPAPAAAPQASATPTAPPYGLQASASLSMQFPFLGDTTGQTYGTVNATLGFPVDGSSPYVAIAASALDQHWSGNYALIKTASGDSLPLTINESPDKFLDVDICKRTSPPPTIPIWSGVVNLTFSYACPSQIGYQIQVAGKPTELYILVAPIMTSTFAVTGSLTDAGGILSIGASGDVQLVNFDARLGAIGDIFPDIYDLPAKGLPPTIMTGEAFEFNQFSTLSGDIFVNGSLNIPKIPLLSFSGTHSISIRVLHFNGTITSNGADPKIFGTKVLGI